jgi:hypothetical protein
VINISQSLWGTGIALMTGRPISPLKTSAEATLSGRCVAAALPERRRIILRCADGYVSIIK